MIITGTKGYNFAQITCGGADTKEFRNFESVKVENLYACGEVLDKQFKCGGYNLNFAFWSGICVADSILKRGNKMIRINEIKLSLDEDESLLKKKASKILKINENI